MNENKARFVARLRRKKHPANAIAKMQGRLLLKGAGFCPAL
jgi:hypothetical protein